MSPSKSLTARAGMDGAYRPEPHRRLIVAPTPDRQAGQQARNARHVAIVLPAWLDAAIVTSGDTAPIDASIALA